MPKVFKIASEEGPRSLTVYERDPLHEPVVADLEEEAVTPEMILSQARDQAEEKVREAYSEGMQRGMEAGRSQFEESVAQAGAALEGAAAAIREAREEFLASLEPQVAELALAIAGRILEREAGADRQLVATAAAKALRHLVDREQLRIRVNPADLEGLRAEKAGLLEEFDDVREVVVEADETVSPGGCIAESRLMQADATVEAQLDAILAALLEAPEPPSEA